VVLLVDHILASVKTKLKIRLVSNYLNNCSEMKTKVEEPSAVKVHANIHMYVYATRAYARMHTHTHTHTFLCVLCIIISI